MPRPPPDPDLVKEAVELVAAGVSLEDAAAAAGVTEGTVRRWVKLAKLAPAELVLEVVPGHMAPPSVPLAPLPFTDPIALVRQLIDEQRAAIQIDRVNGNLRGAASNASTLERLVKSLKQMESHASSDADTISFPRSELVRAEGTLDARIQAYAARGEIRCCDCGRALSVEWGTSDISIMVKSPDSSVV